METYQGDFLGNRSHAFSSSQKKKKKRKKETWALKRMPQPFNEIESF